MRQPVQGVAVAALLLITSLVTFAQSMPDLSGMRKYFKDDIDGKPYALLQTPRSGLGLGSVYTNYRGQSLAYATPEDCFSSDVLGNFEAFVLTIPQANSQSSYSWQVGLKVAAAGAITSDAQAEFDRKKVRNMVLTMPTVTREFWS